MAAVGLIVAVALGAVLAITLSAVSRQSRERAVDELEVARTALHSQLKARAASALAASELVTELPVFRAHLTDARLASDRQTIDAMANGYRDQLAAQFVVVTDTTGAWLASPGWPADDHPQLVPETLRRVVDRARDGTSDTAIVARATELFLAVSTPARFADEILGTFTVGYRITDDLADALSQLAHCDVVVLSRDGVAATSLHASDPGDVAHLAGEVAAAGIGVHEALHRLGDRQFVAGAFPLRAQDAHSGVGRLVLLVDWQPTQRLVDQLRTRFLAGGLVVFVVALAGGLAFSRSVSSPLRDIAEAAPKIAQGDLALRLRPRGSAEAVTVAHAFNDMSAGLQAARDRLVHDAIHDHLTQLPNRALFMERLERAVARRTRRPEYRVAVLFLDMDRFKHVNDSLGHAVGDRLLVAYAERLATVVRRDDEVTRMAPADAGAPQPNTLARFGGDEFLILLDDIRGPIDAARVAERVQRELAVPFEMAGQDVFATASIGVVVSSPMHHAGGDLIRDADLAMSRAKTAGGGCYVVFDETMHDAAVEQLRLETEIRRAIERREFCLWYQPIVLLADQQVTGFEALVRWRHPERGLLAPAAFLAAAEQMGVMPLIDEWALREACRQARVWQLARARQEPLSVSVNLSAKAFGHPSIVSLVADVLRTTELPARALRLEITEGIAIADPARTTSILTDLRSLGVGVSLDDFGTGYSSLSYLQQFPVDALKIDRSFVAEIGEGEGQPGIIQLIVSLARTLGLDVIAEGAETAAQVANLDELGCGYVQGYYFGKPLAAEQIATEPDTHLRCGVEAV